ncbi:MAG: DUF481 domain-containing protein [Proteobacteria bacterium]|jgi:putative salt-induced outer membrane protein|nr:DUF481 domain-containing protein [Pseudomonadota bacterium]
MNRYGIRPYLMLGLLLFAGAAQAVDPMKVRLNGKEKGWKGNIELGYVKTSGNSDTTSGIMKLAITGVFTDWVHDFTSRGYQATDSGNTTASNLTAQWRSNYVLRRQIDYLFGLVRYDNDRFSGYNLRMTEVAGYGHKLIKQEDFSWVAEAGAGGQQTSQTDGQQVNEAIMRLGTWLDWKISKTSVFTYNLFTEIGSSNTYTESDAELSVKINESLAVVLGWLVKNNSDVQPGIENTDMTTTVTLKYAFLN